jgi:hypothetical protein
MRAPHPAFNDPGVENVTDRYQREITDRKQTVGRALFIPLQNQVTSHVLQFYFILRVELVPFD